MKKLSEMKTSTLVVGVISVLVAFLLVFALPRHATTAAQIPPDQQYLTDIYSSGVFATVDRAKGDPYLIKMGHETICPAIGTAGVTHQALVMMGAKGASSWSSQPTVVADAIIKSAEKNLCPERSYVTSVPVPTATDIQPVVTSRAASDPAGPGTYLVGADLTPGVWKSPGPNSSGSCYWERADSNGTILANSLGEGPSVVVVRATDFQVRISRCQPFVRSN